MEMNNRTLVKDSSFKLISLIHDNPLRHRFDDPIKFLESAGVKAGHQVLEVGCGPGFFTLPAAEIVGEKGHVYAIDLEPLAVQEVEKKLGKRGMTNVTASVADAAETGLPTGSIDLVLLFGVIPSPTLPLDRFLPEMGRLLKPDGSLAVWTAFPWWSPVSLTRGGLFAYKGKQNGVHSFRQGKHGLAH